MVASLKAGSICPIVLLDRAIFIAQTRRKTPEIHTASNAQKHTLCVIAVSIGAKMITHTPFQKGAGRCILKIVLGIGKEGSVLCTLKQFKAITHTAAKKNAVSPRVSMNRRETNHLAGLHLVFEISFRGALYETFLDLPIYGSCPDFYKSMITFFERVIALCSQRQGK